MHLAANRAELSKVLGHVRRAATGRATLPICANVLLEAREGTLHLTGHGDEWGLQASLPARVEGEGTVSVPARAFAEAVAGLTSEEVTIESGEGDVVHLAGDACRYTFHGLPAAEYPALPTVEGTTLTIPAKRLREMISAALPCVSTDETRAMLTGVLLRQDADGLQVVATDSYRLALLRCREATGEECSAVVPGQILGELGRLIGKGADTCMLTVSDTHCRCEVGGYSLTSRLIEGSYPGYDRVLDQMAKTGVKVGLTLDRKAFQAALRRAAVMASAEAGKVVFSPDGSGLRLQAESADLGRVSEEIVCVMEGERFQAAFDAEYLLDALRSIRSREVQWNWTASLEASVLRPTDSEEVFYAIMPMQL